MTSEIQEAPQHERQSVEMPRPNVWPMVLGLGIVLVAAGVALNVGFLIAGLAIFIAGLAGWIGQLLPGRGHHHEELVETEQRAKPVAAAPGMVEQLHPGRPGYRFQLPEKVHPISAGVKGGLLGGLVMPLPALAYGILSGHWIWYPVNLLAGMVLPGVENMTVSELEEFHLVLFVAGVFVHAVNSVVFGLLYGVLLPTLPEIPRPLAWGGLLMPLLWSATSFSLMGDVNKVLQDDVSWPWFIVSQFVFGVAAALVVMRLEPMRRIPAGIIGGLVGGLLMPIPAVLWSLANHHGLWYPINLLAGMVSELPREQLSQYHANWLATALVIHAVLSAVFGLVYGLLLPKLPAIPASVAWGGLVMPLLWTATTFSLMRVVNPVLQDFMHRSGDWPWFIVSQFVFGVVAAIVVHRSEQIPVPPAGPGSVGE